MKQHAPDKPTAADLPQPMDERVAARYVGCSARWLAELRLRSRGQLDWLGPRYYTVGRLIRYRRQDLDRWIEERMSSPAVPP